MATKSRLPLFAVIGAVVIALVVVVIVVSSSGDSPTAAPTTTAVDNAALVAEVSAVPAAVFDTVGAGSGVLAGTVAKLGGAPGAKPVVTYVGAEFCPYCAAERWAIITSLSRFGTFSGLSTIHSSEDDLATFSFKGSTFTSEYLTFAPTEARDQQHNALEPVTDAQQAAWKQVADRLTKGSLGFPTIDVGGVYGIAGSSYSPATLSRMTHAQIAASLSDPTNPVAKSVIGASNAFSALVCAATGNQPAAVCGSAGVTAAAAALTTS